MVSAVRRARLIRALGVIFLINHFTVEEFTMSQEMATLLQLIGGLLSSAAAMIAIIIAIVVETRTHRRFSNQLEREEKIAVANLKPLLAIHSSNFLDYRAVTLCNYGIGTAVIKKVIFSKNSKQTHRKLIHLFDFSKITDKKFHFDWGWDFSESKYYLQAGQSLELFKMSKTFLSSQELGQEDINKVFTRWEEQKDGVNIKIAYEDILGNKQEDYEVRLTRWAYA